MNWEDECYLLSKRKFRENANIINVFSKKRGKVVGIELHQGVVNMSIQTIKQNYPELFKYSSSFKILQGSGWDGYPKKSKNDIEEVFKLNDVYLFYKMLVR